ncbi:ribosome biogenesis protein BOP1 homolog [Epargyreus clarus]|uniref:ribosome biogenesis protein BOP1 homolog n=1 Tax=Epargyreus clarus TaxID=520877 RepID=UPI003C2C7A8D
MPPFKTGLVKRKITDEKSAEIASESLKQEEETNSDEGEDLFGKEVDDAEDATDSEYEDAEAASDTERDEVLYDESADSVLDEDDVEQEINSSLDEGGTEEDSNDGETGDSSEGDSDEEDDPDSDNSHSNDSGAESGALPTPSGSGDDSTKNTQERLKKKQKIKLKKIAKENKEKSANSLDILSDKIKEAKLQTEPVQQKDEYESGDTSDEEDRVNTVGDIPMWWYNEYSHVGYDLDGQRIAKPPQRDQIDEFLKKCEDPEFWRTVKDPATGQDIILSKEDLQLIERIRAGRVPNAEHEEYEPWVEWFSREVLATPLRAFPEHKRSFLPSRDEQRRVGRLVHALKMGWTKTRKQIAEERKKKKERKFYDLWGASAAEGEGAGRGPRALPAPRRAPPGHAESYNPPPEYLLDDKELREWERLRETPWRRKLHFLPRAHGSLRAVPAYERFARERFLRCLDLYLAPRAIKMRLTISPEDLVPKLPSPRELQPFPTSEALQFTGHTDLVRSVDFDPTGQYIVSGSDDGTVKIWEAHTARCVRTVALGAAVARVAWAPRGLALLAAAAGARLLLLAAGPRAASARLAARTDELLADPPPETDVVMDARTAACVRWERPDAAQWELGVRIIITHFKPVQHISWHAKGDYLAATLREGGARAVLVHQLSRRRSHLPFRRSKGLVQAAVFHTHRPLLFVATQRAVRVYDLARGQLLRTLRAAAQWLSALALHPAGDNLLVASYDRKCIWFDLELSSSPYQTLRLHGGAVRAVAFHPRYPLFASAGDDPYVVVSHGMVYNDLLQNPLLVPLKQLRAPAERGGLRALDLRWHPARPWLLAAGADATLRLYS